MENTEIENRKDGEAQELVNALNLADNVVYKRWLSRLNEMEIAECPKKLSESNLEELANFYKVERFVYEKDENIRDKLVSVFHAVSSCNGSVVILINNTKEKVEYYFGTRIHFADSLEALAASAKIMQKSMTGNFPGTEMPPVSGGSEMNKLSAVFQNRKHEGQSKQICTVTGVAGLRSKEENREKLFVQGLEKFVDSMRGEVCSLLLIADPVSFEQIQIIKRGYETLYSQLAPFAGSEMNYGENENTSVSKNTTKGLTESINRSVTDTLTYTEGSSDTVGVGVYGGVHVGPVGGGVSVNYSHGWTKSESEGKSNTSGTGEAVSLQIAEGESLGKGLSRSIQFKFENKAIKGLLEKIDLQLKRIDASLDTGMWNCSAYCLADTKETCKIMAASYQALLRGENSSVETGLITEWTEAKVKRLLPYLEKMHHPVLLMGENKITPSSLVSGQELVIHAGLPQSSVSGLPVLELAAFGREISKYKDGEKESIGGIELGKVYHMGKKEELDVKLDKNSLPLHTFITGSTGSGKSNTIYQMLAEIQHTGAHFLVIEPAKGEYKNIFGGRDDVKVYGTNKAFSPLLKINPFEFQRPIHVLEHIDRLIEIFNVCWPMYAAMPAVLKAAVEMAYENSGWDLAESENRFGNGFFPSFAGVCAAVQTVINASEYSDENKGNYKGALITRLKSLCNGINGQIFTNDAVKETELFDKNVIVDLSRIGSIETKALIMGILVMKLQEYRMCQNKEPNSALRHVTVLEEAHNLLKRTSTEQNMEGANILGKSVEMLANAIAEMRSYGEGFIIADQSPGLLDMSVIRNTNTKIILRLPDEGDRVLVGKSAALNDDQIVELAKLPVGAAVVYQNDWLEPVLCKVNEFTGKNAYVYTEKAGTDNRNCDNELKYKLIHFFFSNLIKEPKEPVECVDQLKERVKSSRLDACLKVKILDYFNKYAGVPPDGLEPIYDIIAGLFKCDTSKLTLPVSGVDITGVWAKSLSMNIDPEIHELPGNVQKDIMRCVILELAANNTAFKDLPDRFTKYVGQGTRNGI
jgi:DNA helicase HerA-like ATPase